MFRDKNVNSEKNLKLMILSAIVLVALFIYSMIKSDSVLQNGSYFLGIGFLLALMTVSYYVQKYKEKVRKMIPKNKFQQDLDDSVKNKNNDIHTKQEEIIGVESVTSHIRFKDVAGINSIKEELEEVVDFLNNPKKYQKYDVSLPKGVLLVGPPGVGKTLIAKAVAGEANVPFFYQSGASFVHIYVGMGAKRVRELFLKAKATAPSIIFIDEIDAIGKSRGIGSNDEREATLNELLTQMDGFEGQSGVIVIAATNKIDVLDEALLRAGRFDRRVFLNLPSYQDRIDILNLYLKGKNTNINIDKLALDTSGFNSAALATLVNEALLNMIKREGTTILEDDIHLAKQKVQYGKKQLNILCADQKEILSIYQASKAFIVQQNKTILDKILLFDEGILYDDCLYPSKTQLEQRIKNNLAGSVGLEVIKKEPYAVFKTEIQTAQDIANDMVNKYKMEESVDYLILRLKDELKTQIIENVDKITNLSERMIKEEKIVF
jgi:ATP-dependent metalloprotease FtsH